MTNLKATLIPEDRVYQLMLTPGELSLLSLALAYTGTTIVDGPNAGASTLLDGLLHMLSCRISPEQIIDYHNTLNDKITRLADHLEEESPS